MVIISSFIGLLVVEIFCHLFVPSIVSAEAEPHVIYFFDGPGTIFRNPENIFTYVPNAEIRSLTVSYTANDFSTEYDNHFRTNNLGLVQDDDVFPHKPSLLLLGDSFTEGTGASPWFRLVRPVISQHGFQPINGGIGSTGFGNWLALDRYLTAADIRVRKLVVLFISDDYRRPVRHDLTDELNCLSAQLICTVDRGV
jgi:hypothetical protein